MHESEPGNMEVLMMLRHLRGEERQRKRDRGRGTGKEDSEEEKRVRGKEEKRRRGEEEKRRRGLIIGRGGKVVSQC